MKRRAADVLVTDHAVVAWLVHAQGLDLKAVKQHIRSKVQNGAESSAIGVVVDGARFVLRTDVEERASEPARVVVVTVADPADRASLEPGRIRRRRRRTERDDD